jgi:outer membrane protein TolC
MINRSYSQLILALLLSVQTSFAATRLNPDQYLSQVKEGHSGVKGAFLASQGAQLRSEEGHLLLAPTAFAEFRITADAKLPQFVFLTYDRQMFQYYTFGVRKLTTFGLQASLHYDLNNQYYVNPAAAPGSVIGPSANFINTSYAVASPVFEITQNLWSNGFGRSTRAIQEQHEAQAMASSYQNSFQAKSILMTAEQTFWRLALARQAVDVQKEALDRARKIYEWNSRRARLELGDRSDVIQSEALVQARELELKSAQIEEKLASRAFNSMRNVDSDHVAEDLVELKPELLDTLQVPKRVQFRDDVLAAKENARASTASAEIALERDRPTLDVYASIALNGQSGPLPFNNLSDSISNSFSFNRPTETVGLRFSAPIDIGVLQNSREGWRQEQISADMNFSRKVFEQEQGWKELSENVEESVNLYKLSLKLEDVQKSKLLNERNRLQRGRSTTYQVLLFEQDYLQAQLTRIRNEAKVLNLLAQMKLFGETL